MRLKALKGFSIGKLMEKNKKEKSEDEESPKLDIAESEDTVNENTNDAEKTSEKSHKPFGIAGITLDTDDIPIRPHGPAAELSIDPEDLENDSGLTLDELDNDSISIEEEVKLSEVSAKIAVSPKSPPAAEVSIPEEAKPEDISLTSESEEDDSLSNLFNDEEEEENPLDSLINSLPDVTVQELMDDLEEIKRIIKEWRTGVK